MDERAFFDGLILVWFLLAAASFPLLFFVTAPYGRHSRGGWGPAIPSNLGWILMESPAALVMAAAFAGGTWPPAPASWAFLALWEVHYLHRSFVYPFGRVGGAQRMPISIVATGLCFNVANAYINGRFLFALSGGYPLSWLIDPRFLAGLVLFVAGFAINRHSDHTLRRLRRPGETGYRIPYGGLYRWVSCPNYLGEIVQWLGWAVATWSLAGLGFALWTIANLAPRARAHHRWYRGHFPEYPPERKALLPGLW